MPADFFQRQEEYRAKSRRFFAAFALSVLLSIALFYLAIAGLLILIDALGDAANLAAKRAVHSAVPPPVSLSLMELLAGELPRAVYGDPPRLLAARPLALIGLPLFAAIAGACFYKIRAVKKGGGAYVAAMLGGGLLERPETPKEKQLVNVAEEMAVAAGLPRPGLIILHREKGLNAVAAGFEPDGAVIAVTAGLLERMDRDELQAVVAHEFAHILNGDCALNLTMTGWLHGLLVFSLSGQRLLELLAHIWDDIDGEDLSRSPLLRSIVRALLLIIGSLPTVISIFIMAAGWLGKLFVEVIQAALSRNREYLADAFAARFTRNPGALARALEKIERSPERGQVGYGQADLMKSFFLAAPTFGFSLFRCHPPLEERILALWEGAEFNFSPQGRTFAPRRRPAEALKERPLDWAGVSLLALAGAEAAPNLAEAGRLLYESLPESLRAAALDPALAPVLSVAVFIQNEEAEVANRQRRRIRAVLGSKADLKAAGFSRLLTDEIRTPLLDLAAPALKSLPPEAKAALSGLIKNLIAADGRLSLFEVAAARILQKSLNLTGQRPPRLSAAQIQADAALFLSALAHAGAAGPRRDEAAAAAFQAGQNVFDLQGPRPPMTPRDQIKTRDLPPLLDRLAQAPEKIKARLAAAAVAAILADGIVTPGEYALARALAAALDITLPLRG